MWVPSTRVYVPPDSETCSEDYLSQGLLCAILASLSSVEAYLATSELPLVHLGTVPWTNDRPMRSRTDECDGPKMSKHSAEAKWRSQVLR